MVLVAELVLLVIVAAVGLRWYLRTPMHKARRDSGAQPPQVAGHMGFGMYSPSNPPLLPHALHDHHKKSEQGEEPHADSQSEIDQT